MDETAVTEISGVAESTGENLIEVGFESVEDVVEANMAEIASVQGFGESRAKEVMANAEALMDDPASSEESQDESANDDGGVSFTLSIDGTLYYHAVGALISEAVTKHRQTSMAEEARTYDLIDQFESAHAGTVDRDNTVVIELSGIEMDDLNVLHRAFSVKSDEYLGMSGIELHAGLNTLLDDVNEARNDNWGQ